MSICRPISSASGSTRGYNAPYTPGEQKLVSDYTLAFNQLKQDFTKSHSADDVKKFNQLEGNYSVNNALDWIKQLEGQQAADTYAGTEASLSQSYQQHEAQLQQQLNQGTSSQSGGGGLLDGILGGDAGDGPLDANQKRCLELGGTYDQCTNSLMGAVGALGSLLFGGTGDSANAPPPLSGVILVGSYHSRADLPELGLTWDGNATLQKCGTLVDASHTYTLRKSGATTQVVVDNEPNPIVLTLRSDGSLSGPGNISVKGQIITGYNNVSSCTTGTLAAKCITTSSTPIYQAPACRAARSPFSPQRTAPPPNRPACLASDMFGGSDPTATIYGLRIIGPYASSNGMKLSFDNRYVTLDCGQAHVKVPYTVDNTAAGFVIHVQNSGGAFLLGVAPDNTLRGAGSTTVNGKLVSSVNGKVVSFTPHSESCNVGTFAPKGQRNTMVASNAPMSAAPISYPAASSPVSTPVAPAASSPAPIADALAGAGIASTPGDARAQLRVLLSSNFTGTNPLAGQAVFVSRKPMDQILRELGVAGPGGATPAQAMKALQTQCHAAQGCTSVIQGLSKYYVTTTKLDSTGKATLSATAATGQYYFFAIIASGSGSIVWDVPANLAAGDNSVTFNQANSQPIQ